MFYRNVHTPRMKLCVLNFVGVVLFASAWASDDTASTFSLFPTTVPRRMPTTREESATPEEDLFIKRFGNNKYELSEWTTVHGWYEEINEPKVKELCAKAHQKAGYGNEVRVDVVILNLRTLIFANEAYISRSIDVVTYSIEDGTSIHEKKRYWYVTEGARVDCVFYLTPADPRSREFRIQKHVCGIKVF